MALTTAGSTETAGFHPAGRPYRFVVLFFASLLTYGSYFAYDSVGAIPDQLMRAWGVDQAAIGALYSLYSLAAIVTLLFGGMVIDRFGTRKSSLGFSVVVTLGACVVAFAPNIQAAYLGRFLFGAGSESLITAQNTILARWFKGKELALAFGVTLAISRIGTLFSFNTEALIASRYGPSMALWAAALFCGLSLLSNVIYNALDRKGEQALGLGDGSARDRIVLADIQRFPVSYWYITFLCLTFYSAIFPFIALSTDFFAQKWGLPNASGEGLGFFQAVFFNFLHMFSTAPGTSSIVIFASMVFAPFAGNVVDRVGKRTSLMILGSLLMIPAYLMLALTTLPPAIPMIVLGAAFVIVPAALWPSVPLIVDKDRVGTAYGLLTMIQNIGLMVFPWLNGRLRVATESYTASMLMFASLGLVGLGLALALRRADRREGALLESRT
ncbi:MAG: MFS transporter [Acidobacteria bacterium]|nr:MFS transporter [Acidobacteriota bacterium]